MPELTREEKLKLIEKLPQRLQDFLYSEDTGAFLLYLGNKYKLPDEKISAISTIIVDIILKITPVTVLTQEISNKIVTDLQIAMAIAQELNNELLMPALTPTSVVSAAPQAPIASPKPVPQPVIPLPVAPTIKTDQYREPMREAPEIIDLRKTPPPLPILSPTPSEQQNRGSSIPQPNLKDLGEIGTMPISAAPIPPVINKVEPPVVSKVEPPKPLTFTKPIEKLIEPPKPISAPIPLIEAEPHKIPELAEEPRPPVVSKVEPQFIIRPSGLAPTPTPMVGAPTPVERGVGADSPHDVLDLRKDKGEF